MLFESGNPALIPLPITQVNISGDKINIYLLKVSNKIECFCKIAILLIVGVTAGNHFSDRFKLGPS
ncbi:hypothetical protein [Methanosarcina mazei]|jgi:hypothetical protein|uniref:hypothetical protein n=1 Tax=Methanosarcina mazei TaxID=2209 RepID=UPI00138DFBF3|nr:hypothetical protein [Methanosarcina mazei]